jgi:anti-sigma factor RsiW
MNHPSEQEWMGFLYGEVAPERRRELGGHLAQCGACAEQLKSWRAGMTALDEWNLPKLRRAPNQWQPVVKWAAAAAVVLCIGFALGRQTAASPAEVAALKSSVAELADTIQRERELNQSNIVAVATASAADVLSTYADLDEERRSQDQQVFAAALRSVDLRLTQLRTELETVAVNTEDSFKQTQENLTRLALVATDQTRMNPIP